MISENVAVAGDQLSPATPEREQRRHHHHCGTTWLALLVAALAVVLYSLGNNQELVARRLTALLGKTSSGEVVGQRAEPNGLDDFPALPPLADRNRLWPPAIGELKRFIPRCFLRKQAMLRDLLPTLFQLVLFPRLADQPICKPKIYVSAASAY